MKDKLIFITGLLCLVIPVYGQILPHGCEPNVYYIGTDNTTGVGNSDTWETNWVAAHEPLYCEPPSDGWILVFDDQFNGVSIDESFWASAGWKSLRSNGMTYFIDRKQSSAIQRPEDVEEHDGYIHIKHQEISPVTDCLYPAPVPPDDPVSEEYGGVNCITYNHAVGWVGSKQKFPQGKYVSRIKIPSNIRTWPAYWQHHGWGDGYEEVDGFEFQTRNHRYEYANKFGGTLHGSRGCGSDENLGVGHGRYCPLIDFTEDFHDYFYEWNPGQAVFGFDGTTMEIVNKAMLLAGVNHIDNCDGPPIGEYLKLCKIMPDKFANMNVIFSSVFRKDETDFGTPLPDEMLVDWFKFYMKINCSEIKNITEYDADGGCHRASPTCAVAGVINVAGNSSEVNLLAPTKFRSGGYGDYLTLVGSQEINLLPGFYAEAGSHLDAKIRSCSDENYFMSKKENESSAELFEDTVLPSKNMQQNETPTVMELYPNPNNGKFIISYSLATNTDVEFYITNLFGEKVQAITKNSFSPAGNFSLMADDVHLNSGCYFVTMKTTEQAISKGIVVVN